MTEREEFALAAKAAGAKWSDYSDGTTDHWIIEHPDGVWRKWEPLDNDGDALRLAVLISKKQAGLALFLPDLEDPFCIAKDYMGKIWGSDSSVNPLAATRLAIFRAAVEIGRRMP